jgi:hypothetical protein
MSNDPKSGDPESAPGLTRAQKLREEIKEIVERGKKRASADAVNVPGEHPARPRSLHETFEERMRDHVGQKKS